MINRKELKKLFKEKEFDLFWNVIVFVSFLVSLYGIFQMAGIDIFYWGKKGNLVSPLSTLGLSSFLSAYLTITLPTISTGFRQ